MRDLTPFNKDGMRNSSLGQNFSNMLDTLFGDDSTFMEHFKHNFKIDVKNAEKEYIIQADLPGIKKDEIKVSYNDGSLIINVHKAENKEVKKEEESYIHHERSFSSMSRSIHLDSIDADNIKANLEEGVLTIILPKSEKTHEQNYIPID